MSERDFRFWAQPNARIIGTPVYQRAYHTLKRIPCTFRIFIGLEYSDNAAHRENLLTAERRFEDA